MVEPKTTAVAMGEMTSIASPAPMMAAIVALCCATDQATPATR
nr:hypothetical protein [Microbacterium proteolyticum]